MTGLRRVAWVTGVMLAFVLCLSGCAKGEGSPSKGQAQPDSSRKAPQKAYQVEEENRAKSSKGVSPPERQVSEAQPAIAKPQEAMTKDQMMELDRIKDKTMVFEGPKFKKQIALTFDDGPDRVFTPQILKILKAETGSGYFFCGWQYGKKIPGCVKGNRSGWAYDRKSYL